MDDVGMDVSEPNEDCETSSRNSGFNTMAEHPLRKLRSMAHLEPADVYEAHSQNFGFKTPVPLCKKMSHPSPCVMSANCKGGQHSSEIMKPSRKTRAGNVLLSPDSGYCDSQSSISSESCSFLLGSVSIEASLDSGLDSYNCSRGESEDTDFDQDLPNHLSLCEVALSNNDPSDSEAFCRTKRIQSMLSESAISTADNSPKVWQSTPAKADIKIPCLTFGTPLDGVELLRSPAKRRRTSLRISSRDLFQSSRRKATSVFPRPFLGDYPTSSSLMRTSFVGRDTLDFVSYLGKHAVMQPALDAILGYLEPVDLCRACLVSRSWKNVIESVPDAMHRKTEYVNLRFQMKENLHQPSKKTDSGDVLPHRGQLMAIQNLSKKVEVSCTGSRSPPVSPSKIRFNLFLKEGRKLENGQTLLQCPQCKLPSRREAENAARCTRRGCQYYFCILCRCKFHGDKSCPVSVKHRKRQVAIGSRESRRNLQRLCK